MDTMITSNLPDKLKSSISEHNLDDFPNYNMDVIITNDLLLGQKPVFNIFGGYHAGILLTKPSVSVFCNNIVEPIPP